MYGEIPRQSAQGNPAVCCGLGLREAQKQLASFTPASKWQTPASPPRRKALEIGSDKEYRQVLARVVANRNAVNAVADTTLYSVAANGTLLKNLQNIERHAVWKQHGIRTSPCIYGDTTLATMRLIWSNPAPFIETLLADAQHFGFEGLNLDWEAFGTSASGTGNSLRCPAVVSTS